MQLLLVALAGLLLWAASAGAQTILHYDFDETGSSAASSGSDATPVTLRNDAGSATDLHSADARGVSGEPGDRSYQNTPASDHGSAASAATNGFRADQADLAAVDGLGAFSISGWYKTENWSSLSGKTPRLVENHDGSNGFNLQFLSGSEGDLKLEVDSLSSPSPLEASSGTSGLYAAKNVWIFFAMRYDGAATTNNVDFYRGFRNDVEAAAAGASSAAVQLVAAGSLGCTTCTLNRGPVNNDTAGLTIGNRDEIARPFDGFLDDIRVDAGLTSLEALESYRSGSLQGDSLTITYVGSTNVATTVQDQNQNTVTVNELSALAYAAPADRFYAVSDKNGRVLQLNVQFGASGNISSATALSALTLADDDDFEGLVYTNPSRNSLIASDEESPPQIREYDLATGSLIQTLSVPSVFAASRANLRFEGLSRSLDATQMMAAVQQALTVDGPAGTSTTVPTISRMQRYALSGSSATPAEQYAYAVQPLHATPLEGDGSSLSEVEFLPDGTLLAMERSEADGESLIRIFQLEFTGASDVSQGALASGLIGQSYTPVGKTLRYFGMHGKLEGFALGPQLANGSYVVLAVADNSGSGPNVFHSFVVSTGEPPPEVVPALGAAGAALLSLGLAGGALVLMRRGRR